LFYFLDFIKVVPDILHLFLRITEKIVWCIHQLMIDPIYDLERDTYVKLLREILRRPSFEFKEDTTTHIIQRPNFDGDDVRR
jgi:hypothetical protein